MTSEEQSRAARVSLDGLSVGDAIGEMLFNRPDRAREVMGADAPAGPYFYTDDTDMAIGIVEELERIGIIESTLLARRFAARFRREPDRGYAKGARRILTGIGNGEEWEPLSRSMFGGGSMGNGAAMRVAPLGAFFAGDWDRTVEEARRAAIITHYHPEGVAGAIVVAVAAAVATRARLEGTSADECREQLMAALRQRVPDGETRTGVENAMVLARTTPVADAARELGCGFNVIAPDTVPFCIWNVLRALEDYGEALLGTIEPGGDTDTTAAIVGGIVACFTGTEGIPADWLRERERLRFER